MVFAASQVFSLRYYARTVLVLLVWSVSHALSNSTDAAVVPDYCGDSCIADTEFCLVAYPKCCCSGSCLPRCITTFCWGECGETPPSPTPGPAVCFSERNAVTVKDIGPVPIKDVKVGDLVRVAGVESYETIYSFCKRAPEATTADFIQVFTPDTVEPLELSANHLIFVWKGGRSVSVRASQLQIGDHILQYGKQHGGGQPYVTTVSKLVTGVPAKGAYAPYTAYGTIVVNDILASTYATIGGGNDNDDVASDHPDHQKGILSRGDSHAWWHFAQTHHRVWCRYMASGWCRREIYSENTGLSPISAMSLNVYEFFAHPNTPTIVKWGLSAIIVAGLVLLRALEWTLDLSCNDVMALLLLMITVYYLRVKKYVSPKFRRDGSNQK